MRCDKIDRPDIKCSNRRFSGTEEGAMTELRVAFESDSRPEVGGVPRTPFDVVVDRNGVATSSQEEKSVPLATDSSS